MFDILIQNCGGIAKNTPPESARYLAYLRDTMQHVWQRKKR